MKKTSRLTTTAVAVSAAFSCNVALAAVTCEQLAEIAFVTERLRDNGTPLAAVMGEADQLEASKRFTAAEVAGIRETIDAAFKRVRTSNETLVACRAQTKR
jgi:phosphoribosylamine-glycine ligase